MASMSDTPTFWVGADPGGAGRFGVCLLEGNGDALASTVDCADDAVGFVRKHCQEAPRGVGVDAPLWWSSGVSGDRSVDRWLRKRYGLASGTVQATNSLRGAALVQGVMFVARLREHFPGLGVTETHPKALLKACYDDKWKNFETRYRVNWGGGSEDTRDAVISAVAAREGFTGVWPNDLTQSRLPGEQDPKTFWLAPISYFWPES